MVNKKINGWDIRSLSDVQSLWVSVREVPWRTAGRKHYHEEQYCLGLYLLTLGQAGLLHYPLRIDKGESPDFMVTWKSGQTTGLEVTRATEGWLQREMTKAEKQYLNNESEARVTGKDAEPVTISLSSAGWLGDEAEEQLCDSVDRAIEKKLSKLSTFRPASRYDLLVYDDSPLPAVNRGKVLTMLDSRIRKNRIKTCKLSQVSLIISLSVLFDLGGVPRILEVDA